MMGHLDWLDDAPNNQGPPMKLFYHMAFNYFDSTPKYYALRMRDYNDPRPFIYIVLFLEDGNNEADRNYRMGDVSEVFGKWTKWMAQYTVKELKIMRDDYMEARK